VIDSTASAIAGESPDCLTLVRVHIG